MPWIAHGAMRSTNVLRSEGLDGSRQEVALCAPAERHGFETDVAAGLATYAGVRAAPARAFYGGEAPVSYLGFTVRRSHLVASDVLGCFTVATQEPHA